MTYINSFANPRLGDWYVDAPLNGLGGDRIDTDSTPRNVAEVTGVTLHAMGLIRTRPQCPRVRAHYCVLRDGTIVQNYNENVYVVASNRLNRSTIAVEFSGNFRSEYGSWWRPEQYGRHRLNPEQVLAGRWLLMYLRETLPSIRAVYAHTQAHGRKNCCGPDIWYHVGQWAIDVRHWADETHQTWSHPQGPHKQGRPIPSRWKTWNQI